MQISKGAGEGRSGSRKGCFEMGGWPPPYTNPIPILTSPTLGFLDLCQQFYWCRSKMTLWAQWVWHGAYCKELSSLLRSRAGYSAIPLLQCWIALGYPLIYEADIVLIWKQIRSVTPSTYLHHRSLLTPQNKIGNLLYHSKCPWEYIFRELAQRDWTPTILHFFPQMLPT